MTRSKRKQSGNEVVPPAKRRTRGSSAREEVTNGENESARSSRQTAKPSSPRSPSTRKRRSTASPAESEEIDSGQDFGSNAVMTEAVEDVPEEKEEVVEREEPLQEPPEPPPEEKKVAMEIEVVQPVAEIAKDQVDASEALEKTDQNLSVHLPEESQPKAKPSPKPVPKPAAVSETKPKELEVQVSLHQEEGMNAPVAESQVNLPSLSDTGNMKEVQSSTPTTVLPTRSPPAATPEPKPSLATETTIPTNKELTAEEIKQRTTEEKVIAAAKALPLTLSDKEAAVRAAMQAVAPQMKALQQRWNTALSKLKRKSRRGSRSGVLPVLASPARTKTQLDYLLDEAKWLATDAHQERKWKVAAAKRIGIACAQAAVARLDALGLNHVLDCFSPSPQARAWRQKTAHASEQRNIRLQAPPFSRALLSSSVSLQLSRIVISLSGLALDEPQLEHIVLAPKGSVPRWRWALARRDARVRVIESSPDLNLTKDNVGTLVIVVSANVDNFSDETELWTRARRVVLVVSDRSMHTRQHATRMANNIPKSTQSFVCQLAGEQDMNSKSMKTQHLVIVCSVTEDIRIDYERVAQAEAACLGQKIRQKNGAIEAAEALERLRFVCISPKLDILIATLRQLGGRIAILGSHPEALRLARARLHAEKIIFSEEVEEAMSDEEHVWLLSSRRCLSWTAPVPQVDFLIVLDDDWIPRRDSAALFERIPASCLFRLVLDASIEQRAYQATSSEEQQQREQLQQEAIIDPAQQSESAVDEVPQSQQLAALVRAIPGVEAVLESSSDLCSQGILRLANQPLDSVLALTSTSNASDFFLGQNDDTARIARNLRRATCRLEAARLERLTASNYSYRNSDIDNGIIPSLTKQRKLFYAAPASSTGQDRLGFVAVPADTATFDASLARWPLVQSRTVVHAPEWLRSARVASLNRRLKYNTPATNISRRLGTPVGRGLHTKVGGPQGLANQAHPKLPPLRPPQIAVPPQHRPPLLTIASPHDKPAPAKDDDAKRARALSEAAGRLPFRDILQNAPPGLRLAWGDQPADWRRRRDPESSYLSRRLYAGDAPRAALAAICVANKLRAGELSLTRQDNGPAVPPSVQRQTQVSFRDANWEEHRSANQPVSIVKLPVPHKQAQMQLVPRTLNNVQMNSIPDIDSDQKSLRDQLQFIVKNAQTSVLTTEKHPQPAESTEVDKTTDLAQLFEDNSIPVPTDVLSRSTIHSSAFSAKKHEDRLFPWEDGYIVPKHQLNADSNQGAAIVKESLSSLDGNNKKLNGAAPSPSQKPASAQSPSSIDGAQPAPTATAMDVGE